MQLPAYAGKHKGGRDIRSEETTLKKRKELPMYCLKLKHVWERFVLAGTNYRKCSRCYVTQIDKECK